MARRPRLYVEGCSYHAVQRGNNREACLYREADYAFYLQKLREAAGKYAVAVHAFVLMTNHVHILVTPKGQCGVSRMMQALGRSYVRYMNITYRRTGTLWEGHFKSSLVSGDDRFKAQIEKACAHGVNADVRVETEDRRIFVRAKLYRLAEEQDW